MSLATGLAALAGVVVVLASWEALRQLSAVRLPGGIAAALAPLRRAGSEGRAPSASERRRLVVLATGVLLAGGWFVAGPIAGALAAAAGPWLAVALVRWRRRRYRAEVAAGAPLVARALADALAGGHSIRGAVAQAGRGVPGAAGRELRTTAGALDLGESTAAALEDLRRRAGGRAFDTIVAAILLQRDAGGDLGRLLRALAVALEDAGRSEQDARSATAQARFTALLVAVLPLGAAGLAELADPGWISTLWSNPLSAWLAACALGFQIAGLVAVRRLGGCRP